MTVSKWERGLFAPDDEQLESLAVLFNSTAAALRYGVGGSAPLSAEEGAEDAAYRVLRTHTVRAWLADFRAELTHARATDQEIDRALQLMTTPTVLTFYSRNQVRPLSEDDAVLALEAVAMTIRAELKRRGRKFEK